MKPLPMHPTDAPIELPVLGSEPRPRADAVRNRALILTTAERLFREKGVENVSMDAIACGAGVGKGTLFRRFGDRGSLVRALLEEGEADFQERFIRGPAPLGPGAPPADRLVAFGEELLEFTACHGEFLLAAEASPGMRFRTSVYGAHRAHVSLLVRAGAPELDAGYTADALLSTLSAELVMHQLRGRGVPLADLKAGWAALIRRVVA
ncbi:MAG: TetR/AcrR family transcriptional regulator [Solirubrobacteraceae bacterium]